MNLQAELEAIYKRKGFLTAEVVVEAATPPTHPLHIEFIWDDKIAGHAYRLDQARALIRRCKVIYRPVDSEEEKALRQYHSVRVETGTMYRSLDDIKASPLLTRLVIIEAERRWRALYAQFAHLEEFLEMVKRDIAS